MEDQTQSTHPWRALTAATLLLGGGLFTALGLGAGGLGSATHFYYRLSADLNRDLDTGKFPNGITNPDNLSGSSGSPKSKGPRPANS